jgi:hypothetical protein
MLARRHRDRQSGAGGNGSRTSRRPLQAKVRRDLREVDPARRVSGARTGRRRRHGRRVCRLRVPVLPAHRAPARRDGGEEETKAALRLQVHAPRHAPSGRAGGARGDRGPGAGQVLGDAPPALRERAPSRGERPGRVRKGRRHGPWAVSHGHAIGGDQSPPRRGPQARGRPRGEGNADDLRNGRLYDGKGDLGDWVDGEISGAGKELPGSP